MPVIYKHNLKHFASNKKIAHEPSIKPIHHHDSIKTVKTEEYNINNKVILNNNKDLIVILNKKNRGFFLSISKYNFKKYKSINIILKNIKVYNFKNG